MCRLAYVRRGDALGKSTENYFKHLEKVLGGHGNGIAGYVKNEPVLIKGVDYDCKQAAKDATQTQWDNGYLFHTRLASAGSVCDANNHPFTGKDDFGETFFFCHNGTWGGYQAFLAPLVVNGTVNVERALTITDSETMCLMVERLGFVATNLASSGVWLYFDRSGLRFNVRQGHLAALSFHSGSEDKEGYVVAVASEFPGQFSRRFKDGSGFSVRKIEADSVGHLKNGAPTIRFESGGFMSGNGVTNRKTAKQSNAKPKNDEPPATFGGLIALVEDELLDGDVGSKNRKCEYPGCGHEIDGPLWQLLAHVNDEHAFKPKTLHDPNCDVCKGDLKFADPETWVSHFDKHALLRTAKVVKPVEKYF